MDFSQLDHFYDALAALDDSGMVIYCNESFAQIVGFSIHRIIGKIPLTKLFLEFDGKPVDPKDLNTTDTTNSRVVRFKTKSAEDGVGQYCLTPRHHEGKRIILFVMRDLTLEEQLKSKYRQEMDSKDHKIDEMKSLNNLLQKTRMVREPGHLLREFALHVLNQFKLDSAYIITPEKTVSGIYLQEIPSHDPLIATLGKANLPDQYNVYSTQELPVLHVGFIPRLEQLLVIPIRAQNRNSYLLAVPIYSNLSTAHLDHETIKTLAEQMTIMLENMVLEKLSIYDDLTGLFNARFFREKLDEYTKAYRDLSLVLLDIDFFKKVNDTYGHPAGDLVLQNMGQTLKHSPLKDSIVARVGGEEFAILIPLQPMSEVMSYVEDLANRIRALNMPYNGKNLKVTSSFGISAWNPDKLAVREFYKTADEALYTSKKNGRDRITIYKTS